MHCVHAARLDQTFPRLNHLPATGWLETHAAIRRSRSRGKRPQLAAGAADEVTLRLSEPDIKGLPPFKAGRTHCSGREHGKEIFRPADPLSRPGSQLRSSCRRSPSVEPCSGIQGCPAITPGRGHQSSAATSRPPRPRIELSAQLPPTRQPAAKGRQGGSITQCVPVRRGTWLRSVAINLRDPQIHWRATP